MTPELPPYRPDWAFFLDIDGTLLDIAETPDAVHTQKADCALVAKLHRAAQGALALVSGRSIAMIDELFEPLTLPAAGQHGIERRDARGRVHRPPVSAKALQKAADPIRSFAERHEGLIFEHKGHSMALHYRLAPHLAGAAHAVVRDAARTIGKAFEVQRGKMVAELKPAGHDKGRAIEAFMQEKPFNGRVPVFLGDDLTDEHGFRVVQRMGGHAVKIGAGPSDARWRLANPAAARTWLNGWLESCASA